MFRGGAGPVGLREGTGVICVHLREQPKRAPPDDPRLLLSEVSRSMPRPDRLLVRRTLGKASRRLVGVGEVVARGQGVGVVGAEYPLALGKGGLVQRDGLVEASRRLVGVGEVAARGQ